MKKLDRSQKSRSTSTSTAAPVGGWNARDSLADMAITDAVSMVNYFPSTTTVTLRDGYSQFATISGYQIETLMAYQGGTSEKLIAILDSGYLFDITTGGTFTIVKNMNLTGVAGTYASTPDSAALDITGAIDIRAYIAPVSWTLIQVIIAKWISAGNQLSYAFQLTATGALLFQKTSDGSSVVQATSSVVTGFTAGSAHWVRVTWDPALPVSTRLTFYTSDDGSSWTQLGNKFSFSTTAIFSSTSALEIGSNEGGTSSTLNGKVYRTQIYNGIAGTLVAEFNANDGTVGVPTVVSSTTGETYTLNGAAAIQANTSVSGLSNARFQYVNYATPGGNYLVMCNGADSVYNFDGTTWTNPSITGVTSSSLVNINIHKSRLWFIQNGTLKAWYLPTQSIAGAASALDLSAYCPHGGYLMAMGTWTMDAGYGVDDMAVFITNQGDVLVYRGTDPASATTWALVGVWWIGSPIGRRCFVKYQGDMLIICEDGVYQLSGALQSSRVNPRVALTDKIQQQMSTSVTLYRNNFGWQILPFPQENMVILNVPTQEGQYQEQYVMNTITGAWCQFKGWSANCWELFNDALYFGGNGFVGKAWDTNADNSVAIAATCQQAFNYYKTPGQIKRFTMMRPTLFTNGSPSIQGAINVDFDLSPPTSNLAVSSNLGAVWDTAIWDSAFWQDEVGVSRAWQGATGIGYAGGVRLDSSTAGLQLQWVATEVVMEPGAIL